MLRSALAIVCCTLCLPSLAQAADPTDGIPGLDVPLEAGRLTHYLTLLDVAEFADGSLYWLVEAKADMSPDDIQERLGEYVFVLYDANGVAYESFWLRFARRIGGESVQAAHAWAEPLELREGQRIYLCLTDVSERLLDDAERVAFEDHSDE